MSGFQYCRRSDEEIFLHGQGRFKRSAELAKVTLIDRDRKVRNCAAERAADERRSGLDRRCWLDTRSELDQFMRGELRCRGHRRSRFPRHPGHDRSRLLEGRV